MSREELIKIVLPTATASFLEAVDWEQEMDLMDTDFLAKLCGYIADSVLREHQLYRENLKVPPLPPVGM